MSCYNDIVGNVSNQENYETSENSRIEHTKWA